MKLLLHLLNGAKLYQIFLHVALVVLCVEVVILAVENKKLKGGGQEFLAEQIKSGEFFSLRNLELVQEDSRLDSTSLQVLYVFTTTCPFCKQNLTAWQEIEAMAKEKKISVLGICLDSKDKAVPYLQENNIGYTVSVARDRQQFVKENQIASVPQTILRSADGRVERVWTGLLSQDSVKALLNLISLTHYTLNQ